MDVCDSCNKSHPLEDLLNKYNNSYSQKECKECKTNRLNGCFYEPLFPMEEITPTFRQQKLLGRLMAWCFG